jgi:hypothetical protein
MKTKDRINLLINTKVYAWTVTDAPAIFKNRVYYLTCICECGKTRLVSIHQLSNGKSKSCGCKTPINLEGIRKWKEKNGAPNIKPRGMAAFNKLFNTYRSSAKSKNLSFDLTKEQFAILTKADCHYCGVKPTKILDNPEFNGGYIYNGIDRKNNDIGYVMDNCLTCCTDCNFLKKDRDYDFFINLIYKIYEHRENEKKSQQ